jgi:two-component system chemotaxis response regulator CheB
MIPPKRRVRVVVAPGGAAGHTLVCAMLEHDADFEVVATSRTRDEAVEIVVMHGADLVVMDLAPSGTGSLDAIRRIMAARPVPIVVVTSRGDSSRLAFDAVEAGATDAILAPADSLDRDLNARRALLEHLKDLARLSVVGGRGRSGFVSPRVLGTQRTRLLAIGGSTGGPAVLAQILAAIAPSSPPTLVVQHMEASLVRGFVDWLDDHVAADVVLAEDGARVAPGAIYVAPGDSYLDVGPLGTMRLHDATRSGRSRASIDRLFESAALHLGPNVVGVLLSGMGHDGTRGLESLRRAGAFTIVQEPSTCVVPSMPAAAIELRAARSIAPPEEIARVVASIRVAAG